MSKTGARLPLISLPPWLWLWLVYYVWWFGNHLPWRIQDLAQAVRMAGEQAALDGDSTGYVLLISEAATTLPTLALALGVLLVAAPSVRARWIERRYRLQATRPETPATRALEELASRIAPDVELRWNLLRSDQLALVYPLHYRRDALALFGGMLPLWRRDPALAETVLHHELAHHHRRDALIVGAGSFLERSVCLWWVFVLLLAVPPLILYTRQTVLSVTDLASVMTPWQIAIHELKAWLTLYLPGSGITVLAELPMFIGAFVLFIAAVWCAELQADREAIAQAQDPAAFFDAISLRAGHRRWWRWLLARISHPPASLRRWAGTRPDAPSRVLLLMVIMPLALLVVFVGMLPWGMSNHYTATLGTGTFLQTLPLQLPVWLTLYVGSRWWVFAGMALAIAAWAIWSALRSAGLTAQAAVAGLAAVLSGVPASSPLWLPSPVAIAEAPVQTPMLLNLEKLEYAANEPVVVGFMGMSGTDADGLRIVPWKAPADAEGQWVGIEEEYGAVILPRLPPGDYEIRAIRRHPDGSETTEFQMPFVVAEP